MDPSLLNYLQEDNFVFHEVVPTLQEIASFNVALTLNSGVINHKTFKNEGVELYEMVAYDHLQQGISEEAKQLVQQWNLPQTISDLINEWCSRLAYNLSFWACDIASNFSDPIRICRSQLKCLVWKSSLKIDYEKTARKMLSHPGLSQVDKFRIMCTFCWEDEIESLVPGVELQQFMNDLINDPGGFSKNPLTYYWIRKLSNELHWIPFDAEFDSVELFMLSNHVKHLSSIEYFWDFVNEQDQITIAVKFLDHHFMAGKQIWFFAKMNEFQKRSVIAEIPHSIISNFLRKSNFEAASFVWNRLENVISDDQFSSMLNNIIDKLWGHEGFLFMVELWNRACDHHKNHFVYTKRDFIVESFFSHGFDGNRDDKLPLLFTILSYASAECRKNIILEHGDILFVEYTECSEVNKIIEFCLPNTDDIVQFKELLRSSDEITSYYYKCVYDDNDFKILAEHLESYVQFQSILKYHMRHVLDDDQKIQDTGFYFFEYWSHIKKVLNIVYGTDLSNVIKIKNKLIFSVGMGDCYTDNMPDIESFRHYQNALQDFIDDRVALAEQLAME